MSTKRKATAMAEAPNDVAAGFFALAAMVDLGSEEKDTKRAKISAEKSEEKAVKKAEPEKSDKSEKKAEPEQSDESDGGWDDPNLVLRKMWTLYKSLARPFHAEEKNASDSMTMITYREFGKHSDYQEHILLIPTNRLSDAHRSTLRLAHGADIFGGDENNEKTAMARLIYKIFFNHVELEKLERHIKTRFEGRVVPLHERPLENVKISDVYQITSRV
jgi:hypothetical protein